MPEQNALAKELCEPLEGWRESHGPWKVDPGDDLSEFEAAVLWSSTSRNCSRPTMSATWTKGIKLIARNKTWFKAIQRGRPARGLARPCKYRGRECLKDLEPSRCRRRWPPSLWRRP